MNSLIITVSEPKTMRTIDIEVPAEMQAKPLLEYVMEALANYDACRLPQDVSGWIHQRTGRQLRDEETLHDAGVLNGDVLQLLTR